MRGRLPGSFGSVVALFGAFSVGWALHQTIKRGASVTAPGVLVGLLVGVGCIILGYRLKRRFDPATLVRATGDDDAEEFDESFSPLKEEWLDGHERDDSRNP